MRWAAEQSQGKVVYLHPDVMDKPRRRLRWYWYRCRPLVVLGTLFAVIVLATMLQVWLLSMTLKEVWKDLYYILSLGR